MDREEGYCATNTRVVKKDSTGNEATSLEQCEELCEVDGYTYAMFASSVTVNNCQCSHTCASYAFSPAYTTTHGALKSVCPPRSNNENFKI